MKIIHRYVLSQLIRNLILCLMIVVFLFLVFDFFDRIDNILAEDASVWLIVQYFLYKIPLTISLMLPVSVMAAILLTIGVMSKNSEITAMRASGVTVTWIAMPLFLLGFFLSLAAIVLNETVVPYTQRRAREIYNIDIRQKDKSGGYSQTNFWWRDKSDFYSVGIFDSRDNTLHDISIFQLAPDFEVRQRKDAQMAEHLDDLLGWTMFGISTYEFGHSKGASTVDFKNFKSLPLTIKEKPSDFYDVRTDTNTMSYFELRKFIRTQTKNGLAITGYLAYLYEKFSFPFINLVVALVVLPFALRPARSGSMTTSVIAAMLIGFSYYAIHSFSIAMGRAEFINPVIAAWMANLIMGTAGSILMLGAEAP
jgi:lipopolysaccharide export system permease protein